MVKKLVPFLLLIVILAACTPLNLYQQSQSQLSPNWLQLIAPHPPQPLKHTI